MGPKKDIQGNTIAIVLMQGFGNVRIIRGPIRFKSSNIIFLENLDNFFDEKANLSLT